MSEDWIEAAVRELAEREKARDEGYRMLGFVLIGCGVVTAVIGILIVT